MTGFRLVVVVDLKDSKTFDFEAGDALEAEDICTRITLLGNMARNQK